VAASRSAPGDAAPYSVEWDSAAARDAQGLPFDHLARVFSVLATLVCDPRPPSAGARHGPLKGLLGIAVGRFRILYRVDDTARRLWIARIADRKEVYR
jgi:mRNA-degrading endonuclease RelE of RelBE toxin-antitoxin system